LIVTVFGDAIVPRGGAISLGSLITLMAPFGLNERLVRTASTRLANDHWLESTRNGKLSEYHLSASGRERFTDATARIYNEPNAAWSGRWTLVVIPPMASTEKKKLREELVWRGFGELSTGLYAHPQVDAESLRDQLNTVALPCRLIIFDAKLSDDAAPAQLAQWGWDLEDLAARYQRFNKRFLPVRDLLRKDPSLDDPLSFILRTLLIHEYRRLHLRDPLLPPSLLRPNWPGLQAGALCRELYAPVFAASERHLVKVAAPLTGPLPPMDPAVMQRFGGIARMAGG
jgi:phenylacetic acid degradation operon negative regulatory protein